MTRLKWKLVSIRLETVLVSICLEIVLILTQDNYMVCVVHAIGSEIVWTRPMQLLGDVGHVESLFFPFGNGASVGAR